MKMIKEFRTSKGGIVQVFDNGVTRHTPTKGFYSGEIEIGRAHV